MKSAEERTPDELKQLYSLVLQLTRELAVSVGERFAELQRRYPMLPNDTLPPQGCEAECARDGGHPQPVL
jgi:hypothetical protein